MQQRNADCSGRINVYVSVLNDDPGTGEQANKSLESNNSSQEYDGSKTAMLGCHLPANMAGGERGRSGRIGDQGMVDASSVLTQVSTYYLVGTGMYQSCRPAESSAAMPLI